MQPSEAEVLDHLHAVQLLAREAADALRHEGLEVEVSVRAAPGADARAALRRALEAAGARHEALQALQRLAALGQIGAGVTHEVRNAMTGMLGFAQVARRRSDKPAVDELLVLIESETRRCLELLSSFLGFARPRPAGKSQIDLREVVAATERLLRPQLHLRRVRLVVDHDSDVPPVAGRAAELQQILLNLALNSVQAMPNGGQVTIRTRRGDDGDALVGVSDTGPGIPRELRDRIFEPFFTTKPDGQGTGLGLAVSQDLARAHGGELFLGDAPAGRGASFWLRLPAWHGSGER